MPPTAEDSNPTAGHRWAAWFDGLHLACMQRARPAPLVKAKQYIDRRFLEPVPVETMAAEAGLSKYHFVRAYRGVFRQTPHRYLVERRITRARELLERTELSVTEICFEVGFESLGSFVTRFRELVGEPPGRYRRRFARQGQVDERPIPACLYKGPVGVGPGLGVSPRSREQFPRSAEFRTSLEWRRSAETTTNEEDRR